MNSTEPDSTTERRSLLAVLLSRFERGVITDQERPLLRPLVEAEMAHGQAVIDQFAADAPWLKAAAEDHEALRQRFEHLRDEARRQGEVHERTAQRAVQAEAAIARVRELAEPATHYDDVPQDRLARNILAAPAAPGGPR